jgi:hypothetical protein
MKRVLNMVERWEESNMGWITLQWNHIAGESY